MNPLNIQFLVQEFYALEAISALLSQNKDNKFEPMRHSHNRWYRDFNDFRSEYIGKFASALFDYTVLVVAGELRHSGNQSSQYIAEYYTSELQRNAVYGECAVYRAVDMLAAGVRLFDTRLVTWNSGFGGEKWKQIAKAGLMKGKVCDGVFIDHCVDLSHNNSVYFDKGAGMFHLSSGLHYREFLNLKQDCLPQALLSMKQGFGFNQLLQRAFNLNIINMQETYGSDTSKRDEAESRLMYYQPIKWGDKPLDYSENNIISVWLRRVNERCEDNREDLQYAA